MTGMRTIQILWDASHLWGLMAWRALRCLGLPCRLCRAGKIAEGGLLGKELLLVPGGNARLKARRLGRRGMQAIRDHVAAGGVYMGFCGGAGLALTSHGARSDGASLNICPWSRAGYPERLHHLISGHVRARMGDDTLSLPVWWPGRFAPQQEGDVQVLATYAGPDTDLWLADLALSTIPPHVSHAWQEEYGLNLSADHMDGLPLVVTGHMGAGRYLLSYSHLETPESPQANAWLAQLLRGLGLESAAASATIPAWDLDGALDPAAPAGGTDPVLAKALRAVRALLDMGCEQHLLFRRTSWLWGWRAGLPGAVLNYLHTALATAITLRMDDDAACWWRETSPQFAAASDAFMKDAEACLLAFRLRDTVAQRLPDAVNAAELNARREHIFGHPMTGGGMAEALLTWLEELIYRAQDGAAPVPSAQTKN